MSSEKQQQKYGSNNPRSNLQSWQQQEQQHLYDLSQITYTPPQFSRSYYPPTQYSSSQYPPPPPSQYSPPSSSQYPPLPSSQYLQFNEETST